MSDVQFVLAPGLVSLEFEDDPALVGVDSLANLLRANTYAGLPDWVYRAANRLTPEDRRDLELALDGFGSLFYDKENETRWPSFQALVDALEATDPADLMDRFFTKLCGMASKDEGTAEAAPPDRAELLADREVFLGWLDQTWMGEELDRELFGRVHELLQDPPGMQRFVVATLRGLWDKYLAAEWPNVQAQIAANLAAFRKQHFRNTTVSEALRTVTGRELPGAWEDKLGAINRLTFIPAPHLGPYLVGMIGKTAARIMFGAPPPHGAAAEPETKSAAPTMSRSELLVRLNMLGDDVRLQILELLVQEQELCAQEIISRLELSQSSASRHLAQLTATGYIKERRREVNKCYSLNRARIEDTLNALAAFFQKR